jgi:predicted Zn-dependent protease
MKLALLSAALLTGALAISACTVDGNALAPIVGQRNAQLLSAGVRSFNATQLSEKDEDVIGQSVAVSLTNRYRLVPSDDLQRYVNLVGLTVANHSMNPGGNWVFGVVDSLDVNAFSGPNGYVFITRGALLRMQDEAALAGVLAHEIAHCTNHDGLKNIQAAEQRQALNDAMKAADSRTAQLAVYADSGVDIVTKSGYDQPQEFKADDDGTRLMFAANYDPNSYLTFLRNLQSSGSTGGGQIMSTHPGISQRVARVSATIQALPRSLPSMGATLKPRFDLNMQRGGIK